MAENPRDRRLRVPTIVMVLSTAVGALLYLASTWLEDATTRRGDMTRTSSWKRSAVSLAHKLDLLEGVERASYDWRALLASRTAPEPSPELGFVFIDDESIRDIGRGETLHGVPFGLLWPRYLYARVLRELEAQGAKTVGFDVFFSDIRHDHSSLSIGSEVIDSDIFFRSQILKSTNITLFLASVTNAVPAFLFREGNARMADVYSLRDSDGVARRINVVEDYRIPAKPLEIHAFNERLRIVRFHPEVVLQDYETFALTTNVLDANGRMEMVGGNGRVRLIPTLETPRVWSMGIQMAAAVLGLDLGQAQVTNGVLVLPGTNGVSRRIPLDRQGRMIVDWTVSVARNRIFKESFEEVLGADVLREKGRLSEIRTNWAGKHVLVGSLATANNMSDLGATPLRSADFLPGTHINVANSIVQNRFVHQWPVGLELMLVIAAGLLAGIANLRFTAERASTVVALLALGYGVGAVLAYLQWRLWLPLAHPIGGGFMLTHGAMLTYRAFFEQRERMRIKAVFSKLVSPEVVQELLRLDRFALGGARRQITVFFADVRGFTEMTDRRQAAAEEYVRAHGLTGEAAEAYYEQEAKEVLDTVNRYLAAIADVVKQHNGTLDKYIGDCVMAFWGAPTGNPKHAVYAVRAAIDAQRVIHELNEVRAREDDGRTEENARRIEAGLPPLPPVEQLSLGTGVNTGTMMVGLMGSEDHTLNYTAFGREVNLASRLEGVSGRARIIIGEATYRELLRHAPDLAELCVMRESVQVKGFRGAVTNYEVMWRRDESGNTIRLRRPGTAA